MDTVSATRIRGRGRSGGGRSRTMSRAMAFRRAMPLPASGFETLLLHKSLLCIHFFFSFTCNVFVVALQRPDCVALLASAVCPHAVEITAGEQTRPAALHFCFFAFAKRNWMLDDAPE